MYPVGDENTVIGEQVYVPLWYTHVMGRLANICTPVVQPKLIQFVHSTSYYHDIQWSEF